MPVIPGGEEHLEQAAENRKCVRRIAFDRVAFDWAAPCTYFTPELKSLTIRPVFCFYLEFKEVYRIVRNPLAWFRFFQEEYIKTLLDLLCVVYPGG